MNRLLLCVKHLLFLLFFSTLVASDFEQDFGRGTESWEHVRTVEDRQLVSFYKRLYKKSLSLTPREEGSIPLSFHLIWLGPNPLPEQSKRNAEKWHLLHPEWTFYYWSDVAGEPPFSWMVMRPVNDFDLTTVGDAYDRADNFREKAFLLTLEILHREGGMYVDHDVEPKGQLTWHCRYDFFATLSPLKPSIFSSSVFISPHLIAGKPGHPFFMHAMTWFCQNGEKYGRFFPGNDPLASIYRTQTRIYESLRMGAKRGLGLSGQRDIIFPPLFFNEIAIHEGAGAWKQMQTVQEQKIRTKIDAIYAQLPVTTILILLITAMIPLTWITIYRRRS